MSGYKYTLARRHKVSSDTPMPSDGSALPDPAVKREFFCKLAPTKIVIDGRYVEIVGPDICVLMPGQWNLTVSQVEDAECTPSR